MKFQAPSPTAIAVRVVDGGLTIDIGLGTPVQKSGILFSFTKF